MGPREGYKVRTAVPGLDLGDAVDAGFELGLSLPELREGRGEMGEFLGGWVLCENPKQQQQQPHAHVVQLLLDVSKLGDVEIANPDRPRWWWRRRHVGHTVTHSFFPSKEMSVPQDLGMSFCLSLGSALLTFCCLFVSVAMFHASFHPTQGNVVDWSLKASHGPFQTHTYIYLYIHTYSFPALDLSLDHLEFSALPSGLHLVEQDVVCVLSWCFSSCVLKFPTGILQKTANMVSAYSNDEKRQKKATEASDLAPSVFFSPGPGDPVHGGMSLPSRN